MKLILSRKGFDSSYGGCPSPILPDGTLLSMPIPDADEPELPLYQDLFYHGRSLEDIRRALGGRKYTPGQRCHLDPDIRPLERREPLSTWAPAFGQCGSAQGHLRNQGVGIGDIFLFFGLYRQTEITEDGGIRFLPRSQPRHIMYGYFQIGDIITGEDIPKRYP